MFNNLLESKPKKQRTLGGLVLSGVIHALLISAAVTATLQAKEQLEKPKAEKVDFVTVKKEEPPPPKEEPKPLPKDVVVAPPPPKGFQVLTAPIKVPDVLPDIDLSKKVTDEADFTGKGVAGGKANGVVGGTAPPVNTDQPYFEFQVEKTVSTVPGGPTPRYPDMLKSANIEGEVQAQFVVDENGRYEAGTFKALKASHELFAAAVKNVLPNMRFYPAEVGGKKVKQLVQQTFTFALSKS